MPLLACPDCEKPVSDTSASCIHCGRPMSVAVAAPAAPTSVPVTMIASAPSAYACPKCGSEDTKKLSVIWRDGVQAINTGTVGVAVGLDRSVAIAGARTQGTAQNASSMIAAPPKKQEQKGIGAAVVFTLVALFGLLLFSWGGLLIAVIAGGVVYASIKSYRAKVEFNRTQHPLLMQQWESSYRCGRCENVYSLPA
jgi:hypothetical protein